MDIGAYAKINDLSTILDSTGINIPRLRGLRLMAMEERITEEEIKEMTASAEVDAVEDLVRACPPWSVNSDCHSYCRRTDDNLKRFLVYTKNENGYERPTAVRWGKIHGKRRKKIKLLAKTQIRHIRKSIDTFNKYAGRKDVLYVHARIGGNNWVFCGGQQVAEHPAFIERVDDWCDSTYCDIYLKIDEKIVEKYLKKRKNNNKECTPKLLLLSISRCKNRSGLFRFYSNFHILNTK